MAGISLSMFVDRAGQLYGDRIATRFHKRDQTWRELAESSARLAGGLTALGVGRGDRVAMLAQNSDRYFALFYACWRIGAAVVPLNTRWAAPENRFAIEDVEPRVLFMDGAFLPQIDALTLPGVRLAYMGEGETPPGLLDWNILAASDPAPDAGAGGPDLAGVFYTGGTTGRPKGAMLSHEGLAISLLASGLSGDPADQHILLTVLPLFHLSGAQQAIGAAIRGSTTRILSQFDVPEVLSIIERERITQMSLVPAMWGMVLNHPDFAKHNVSSLRAAMYGAAPMPEGTVRAAIGKLPGAGFAQGYGQTETSGITTLLGPGDHDPDGAHPERLRSAGTTLPFAQVKVCDEGGREAPRGEVGELRVRGPHVMLGYWRRPEETAATLIDGWIKTGDAARMDKDGYVFIVDRVKDMIISGGENIFSAEVENAVSMHPDVQECAVIGAPDERWGERVVAIVRPAAGRRIDPEGVIAFCRERIAGYKLPREVVVRDEPFPLSPAGKILKRDLRAPYWAGRDRAVN